MQTKFWAFVILLFFLAQSQRVLQGTPIFNPNFIVNGDFSRNGLGQRRDWIVTRNLFGWQTSQVQVGKGSVYNNRWGNRIVVQLDGNGNNIIRQRVYLKAGEYILKLKYAARTGYVKTSAFSVYWNGKLYAELYGKDDNIYDLEIRLCAQNGWNVLQIRGEGTSDSYGMTISDISLRSNELLVNGDFSRNGLGQRRDWIVTRNLFGWQTSQVQVGKGSVYNNRWGNRIVVQLDGNGNNIIRQRVYLKAGEYIIGLKYAARAGYVKTSAFSVYWNGKLVELIFGKDEQIYEWQRAVLAQDGQNVLQIRGEGKSDSYGMTVADVRILLQKCPK